MIQVADDRQLISINMDGGNSNIFDEDPRITSIAVDSLNGLADLYSFIIGLQATCTYTG